MGMGEVEGGWRNSSMIYRPRLHVKLWWDLSVLARKRFSPLSFLIVELGRLLTEDCCLIELVLPWTKTIVPSTWSNAELRCQALYIMRYVGGQVCLPTISSQLSWVPTTKMGRLCHLLTYEASYKSLSLLSCYEATSNIDALRKSPEVARPLLIGIGQRPGLRIS